MSITPRESLNAEEFEGRGEEQLFSIDSWQPLSPTHDPFPQRRKTTKLHWGDGLHQLPWNIPPDIIIINNTRTRMCKCFISECYTPLKKRRYTWLIFYFHVHNLKGKSTLNSQHIQFVTSTGNSILSISLGFLHRSVWRVLKKLLVIYRLFWGLEKKVFKRKTEYLWNVFFIWEKRV